MVSVTILPRGREFSRADLEAMPDDGRRYELIDGSLIVTPAPRPLHQRAAFEVAVALRAGCPPELEVMMAPLDVVLGPGTVLQPDVLVARRADFTDKDLPSAPVLVVEVLSASTRRIDLNLKRSRYETAGSASYWVVDPDVPSITAWELHDGEYDEAASVVGDDAFVPELPFAVRLVPADLVR